MASTGKVGSYGLKEVADVRFYSIATNTQTISTASFYTDANSNEYYGYASASTPDFLFDSLKVSNIEVSSEETSARGGKGNPELISWSYGKEVTLTIEDALFNLETLDLIFGAKEDSVTSSITIDANTFPGLYTICGSTVMRSYTSGKDEPFGFIIPKGKINVGGTLTMEAEGDPSTFEMTIKAMSATLGDDKDVLIKFEKKSST